MNQIPRALYTSEFREQAVKLALSGGVGVSEAASRLSVPMKTLANWVRSAKAGKLREVGKEQKPQTGLEAGLARVQRELAQVKMERDLLKKTCERARPCPKGRNCGQRYTDAHQGERLSNYW